MISCFALLALLVSHVQYDVAEAESGLAAVTSERSAADGNTWSPSESYSNWGALSEHVFSLQRAILTDGNKTDRRNAFSSFTQKFEGIPALGSDGIEVSLGQIYRNQDKFAYLLEGRGKQDNTFDFMRGKVEGIMALKTGENLIRFRFSFRRAGNTEVDAVVIDYVLKNRQIVEAREVPRNEY